ncbi:hypothetical protein WAI453_002527 [Rhynchosporium graminicola]
MPPNVEVTKGDDIDDIDEIEYAPPYHNGLPAQRSSLVASYDSPSPEPDHGPDFKPPQPLKKVVLPPADPLQSILDLPILRPIPWREGHELPPDKSTEHERMQPRSATIMTTRGDIADPACASCARGVGHFAVCIVKEGYFLGACATCYFNHNGVSCSFRKEKEAGAKAVAAAKKAQNHGLLSPGGDTIHVNAPPRKRKRTSTAKASHNQVAEEGGAYSYEKSFDDDPNALLQFVYNQQQQINSNGGTKRHHQQHLAERDDHESRPHKSNGHDARRESYRVGEGSYSPAGPYGTRERSSFNESNLAGAYNHRESRDALPQDDEPLALIDTFPRKKQKQIFAVIGSLQSGIRTSRQQTENLQRQLDSLQTILGIEPEEVEYN